MVVSRPDDWFYNREGFEISIFSGAAFSHVRISPKRNAAANLQGDPAGAHSEFVDDSTTAAM